MSIIKRIIMCFVAAVMLFTLLPLKSAAQENVLTAYPAYDSRISRCYEYEVSVTQNNTTVPLIVYDRCNSSTLLGDRTARPDMHRRFCEFAFSGDPVTVNIRVKRDFESYSVIPSAKRFPASFNDGVVSVTVSKPDDHFILRLDSDDNSILSVFADKPEDSDYCVNDGSALIIDDKWSEVSGGDYLVIDGKTSFVKSLSGGKTIITPVNDTQHPVTSVYIAPGCVLNSRVRAETPGVRIFGHGIILDPYSDIFSADIRSAPDKFFVLIGSMDCSVSDIKLIDSQNYSLTLGWLCDRSAIKNVKILAATMCTDGLSVFESRNINVTGNFIYAGDNAIVFGGDCGGSLFENNIIGTTCAAFFPQSSIYGTVTFRDSYVFRCDEGCVNNWYGASGEGSEIENIIFDGLDCSDVTSFPWLFRAHNQGSPAKNFTFNDTSIVSPRGTPYVTAPSEGTSVIISADSHDQYPASGYRLDFNDFYIDGKAVGSVNDLIYSAPTDSVTMNFSNSGVHDINILPVSYVADYIYPFKIFIGSSETFLPGCPIENESGILLPSSVLGKLGIKNYSGLILVDGNYFIGLSDLRSFGVDAVYDKAKGSVLLSKPPYKTDNLIKDNASSFSCWTEMICYESDLTASLSGGARVYKLNVDSAYSAAGMKCFVTDEVLRCGSGKYRFTFRAKSSAGSAQNARVAFNLIPSEYGFFEQTIQLTGEWQSFSLPLDLSKTDFKNVTDALISIGNKGNSGFSAEFSDFGLFFEDGAEKPACDHSGSKTHPSCTQSAVCSVCGKIIPASGHTDFDFDGRCDACGTVVGKICDHFCHSQNRFIKFVWNFVNFFNKIFGIKQYCECGRAHY